MSTKGIKLAAEAFSHLQRIKGELINLGSKDCTSKSGQQDIRLGQLMDLGKDAMKHKFNEITIEPIKEK